ncbi:hypothetical protein EW093_11930 [Thiospirochaeta perfilievii]|uniref:Pyrroline-5-carboxylate reductase dimerisation domain-containing protein n=1 Tax=Thiospirochaeta perfilievii TaxID=252967 RepID=A0A5C1QEH5_9SPIO|nr:pyrroline-5-carboxylate reductase dimerization domain-containing protein [Thiospirochaeta perfilievii]QEN05389.1 hypothetical protein EW093_11930 [Thiospirochaeta perfilievii]
MELLIEKSDIIISSVTAEAQKSILEVIKGDKHFISVSNALLIKEMSKVYPGRVSRVMPTVALGGYTLITKGAEDIKDIFSKISTPIVVEEKDFDLFTLITSSGPGLFTTILEVLVDRFSENTNYDKNIIKDMINSTFSSTLKTLIEQNIEYKTLINRVATKGGLTEVGVNVIRQNMPKVVSNVIESSLKYNNKKTKENIF